MIYIRGNLRAARRPYPKVNQSCLSEASDFNFSEDQQGKQRGSAGETNFSSIAFESLMDLFGNVSMNGMLALALHGTPHFEVFYPTHIEVARRKGEGRC